LRSTARCVQTLQGLIASVFLWSVCLTQVSGSVSANDTEAAFGAGGLVFQKSTDMALLSEELFVSLDEIVVKYRFRNDTSDDVSTIVAFPLPAIRYDPTDPDNEYGFSFERFHGFTTTVDGTPIQARVEEKAMLSGGDETLTLNRFGMSIDPWVASKAITRSPETTKAKLKNSFLIDDRGNPRWKLVRTYYWTQRFPAGREVAIEHRYKPMVGRSVATGLDVLADPKSQSDFYKRFCVDKTFLRAVRKRARVQQTPDGSFVEGWSESWVEYILTTGANWSGPIRKFRLVVDKGRKGNLVSFCGEGVRKIGPTLFEVTTTDFVPQKDLFFLVLTPTQLADGSSD
jgi:hypothetical protein